MKKVRGSTWTFEQETKIMEGRFIGRDIMDKPSCPFCGLFIEKPRELFIRMPIEMPVGLCSCGAVYACDVTGHNLGTAMIEALVVSCNGDWDLAFDLLPEEDYQEQQVDHYDLETHLIIHGGAYEGRQINGALYFVRLEGEIQEVTEEGTRRLIERSRKISGEPCPNRGGDRKLSKLQVEAMVKKGRMDDLLALAGQGKRLLRCLQRILYSIDPQVSRRAAEAMGRASALIAEKDPGMISRQLQGLFTAITDTAASSWGYIGAIGQIIRHNPRQFSGYIPELYRLMRDRALLPDVLDALAMIAEENPEALRSKTFHFLPLLQDRNPKIRAYTVILLGSLGAHEAEGDLRKLVHDTASVDLYRQGRMKRFTVGELASEAALHLSDTGTPVE